MYRQFSHGCFTQLANFSQMSKNSLFGGIIILLPIAEVMVVYPGYGQTVNQPITQVAQVPSIKKLPANGAVKQFWKSTSKPILAPLKIYIKGNRHYFIKVVNPKLNQSVLTVFIRAGKDVSVKVPIGTYEIKYATGTQWYGENNLFGANTLYGQAEKQLVFQVAGNKVRGYRLYLYPQVGGNLKTKPINRNQFSTKASTSRKTVNRIQAHDGDVVKQTFPRLHPSVISKETKIWCL